MSNGKIEIHFSGTDDMVPVLREYIRRCPVPSEIVREEPPNWVLVKHWHDSGGIEGVYGPYTKERAMWLLTELTGTDHAWTATELKQEPEP